MHLLINLLIVPFSPISIIPVFDNSSFRTFSTVSKHSCYFVQNVSKHSCYFVQNIFVLDRFHFRTSPSSRLHSNIPVPNIFWS